jgi:predicted transcriptional regulator
MRELDFDGPASLVDHEDEEAIAAIDEGLRDAEAGHTVSMDEVRKLLPQWSSVSRSPNGR